MFTKIIYGKKENSKKLPPVYLSDIMVVKGRDMAVLNINIDYLGLRNFDFKKIFHLMQDLLREEKIKYNEIAIDLRLVSKIASGQDDYYTSKEIFTCKSLLFLILKDILQSRNTQLPRNIILYEEDPAVINVIEAEAADGKRKYSIEVFYDYELPESERLQNIIR